MDGILNRRIIIVGIVSAIFFLVLWFFAVVCKWSTKNINAKEEIIVPVPKLSYKVSSTNKEISFIMLGKCDIAKSYSEWENLQWQFVEQMGAAHSFQSGQNKISVVAHRVYSIFTRLDYVITQVNK